MVPEAGDARDRSRVGLCWACRYARRVHSDRGSLFYLCQRSFTDKRFATYPKLPVIECVGFENALGSKPVSPPNREGTE